MRRTSIRKQLAVLLLAAGAAPIALADGSDTHARTALYDLMAERLALMPAVAAAKWQQGQPVEDLPREAVVVADARAAAARHGLDADGVAALFRAQIAAAKAIQAYWFDTWAVHRATPPAPAGLSDDIRPALSRLGDAIVVAVARAAATGALATPDRATFDQRFDLPGLVSADRDLLFDAVAGVRVLPHRLARILASGRLRIGTTGDYAPFSHQDADAGAELSGIDIDLARDLSRSLDVEPEFVLTSWPGLLTDLAADRYDIAMSGISRIPARQRVGFLSQPYHADGKTPIGRCADGRRFTSFERIDRPGVRVVVNPGGTNERFVDDRVRRASKVSHPDNRTIFAELLAGRADVMFTDRIEVELQTARLPGLCGFLDDNLTYQEKAFLLPQDAHWLAYVDTWLALRLAEGAVDDTFAAHGVRRRLAGVSARPSN